MPEKRLAEAFHPGEYLRDELEERGWSQSEFAEIIGRPVQLVNEVISGKRGLTPETAKAFAAALGTSAELWMNLDSAYQLWKTAPASPSVAKQARIREVVPSLREMIRRQWIQPSEDPEVLESRILRYFEISNLDEKPSLAFAAKQSVEGQALTPVQLTWLYRVKHIAEQMNNIPYSRDALVNCLQNLRQLTKTLEGVKDASRLIESCGVRLVIVEPLASSKIDGVCFWIEDSPVVGLSLRFDRIDNFWFVLRHELEHVLQEHGKKTAILDSSLDETLNASNLLPEERIANEAAAEFCVPQQELNEFILRTGPLISRKQLLGFSIRIGVHPGIIVGQLQRRLNRYDLFRNTLEPIRGLVISSTKTDGYGFLLPLKA